MNPQDWIPNHQFGFRQAHSTAQQCHRITDVINKAIFKIKRILPSSYFNLLKSNLNEHQFETKFNGETSSRFHNHSGVPQGRIRSCLLYVLYTSDLPASRQTTLGTFVDGTAIFATHEDPTIASLNLQEHLHITEKCLKKWKIRLTNPSHRI